MLLGKRLRPPMKRTTSMSEFSPDMTPPPPEQDRAHRHPRERQRAVQVEDWLGAPPAPVPRGGSRRNSGDFAAMEMAPFLKACGLCKRRLGPGKDIFMYSIGVTLPSAAWNAANSRLIWTNARRSVQLHRGRKMRLRQQLLDLSPPTAVRQWQQFEQQPAP